MAGDTTKFKNALTKARTRIVNTVSKVAPLLDDLASELNDDERQTIESLPTEKDRVRKLLDILGYRPKVVPQFYRALKEAEYNDAAETLAKELPLLKELDQPSLTTPVHPASNQPSLTLTTSADSASTSNNSASLLGRTETDAVPTNEQASQASDDGAGALPPGGAQPAIGAGAHPEEYDSSEASKLTSSTEEDKFDSELKETRNKGEDVAAGNSTIVSPSLTDNNEESSDDNETADERDDIDPTDENSNVDYVSDSPHETMSDSDLNDACQQIAAQESTSYFTTNNTFHKNKEQKFSSAGGKMYCCDKCKDYLKIPKGAINEGKEYIIVQSFPFLCCNTVTSCDYSPVCIKEYQIDKNYKIDNFVFQVHVKLVAYFTAVIDKQQIRVRYNVSNGTFAEALPFDESLDKKKSDVYYKLSGKKVKIYTKHFTVFIVDIKSNWKQFFSKSPTQRFIELVMHAYYRVHTENSTVILRVYIRDIIHKRQELLKKKIDDKEIKKGNNLCYLDDEPLTNLPEVIRRDTQFQCLAVFCKSMWKKWIITMTQDLDSISSEEASNIDLQANLTSDFGYITQSSLKAEKVLDCKKTIQPCLGDFHLQHDLTETVFAPIVIIKTITTNADISNDTVQQQQCFMSSAKNIHFLPPRELLKANANIGEQQANVPAEGSKTTEANFTPPNSTSASHVQEGSVGLNFEETLQLRAYSQVFKEMQINIEQFRVGDHLLELKQSDVLDNDIHLKLVGGQNPLQRGPIFYYYLLERNNINIYNSFIKVCDKIDPPLAKSIRKKLRGAIKRIGLTDGFNPPSSNTLTEYSTAKQVTMTGTEA